MHRPKSALPPAASPSRKGGALHLLSPSRRAPPRSPSAPSCRLNCYSDFFPVGGSRSAVRGPSAELDLCAGSLTKLEAKNHSGTQARFARTARVVVGALKTDGGTESSFTLLPRSLALSHAPSSALAARARPSSDFRGGRPRPPSVRLLAVFRPNDRPTEAVESTRLPLLSLSLPPSPAPSERRSLESERVRCGPGGGVGGGPSARHRNASETINF